MSDARNEKRRSFRAAVLIGMRSSCRCAILQDICTYCDRSPITARRDLPHLEELSSLRRTRGGAMAAAALPPSVQQMPRFGAPEARLSLLDRSHVLIVTPAATSAPRHLVERVRRVDLRQRVTLACWQFHIAA